MTQPLRLTLELAVMLLCLFATRWTKDTRNIQKIKTNVIFKWCNTVIFNHTICFYFYTAGTCTYCFLYHKDRVAHHDKGSTKNKVSVVACPFSGWVQADWTILYSVVKLYPWFKFIVLCFNFGSLSYITIPKNKGSMKPILLIYFLSFSAHNWTFQSLRDSILFPKCQ